MFDTHAIARRLTGAGPSVEQADAITDAAVRNTTEHGGQVTPKTLRAELSSLESTWRFVGDHNILRSTGVQFPSVPRARHTATTGGVLRAESAGPVHAYEAG